MNKLDYLAAVSLLPFGKHLPTAVYLLDLPDERIPWILRTTSGELRRRLEIGPEFNLLKLSLTDPKISFLEYPQFDTKPHPELARSVVVDLVTGKVRRDDYRGRKNPPILHRKELFVPPEYPRVALFQTLTQAEEAVGLLEDTARIGFKLNWERILAAKRVTLRGHLLTVGDQKSAESSSSHVAVNPPIRVARDRTALVRAEPSRPLKLILETNQLRPGRTFFDYGCGLGSDVRAVTELGYPANGWDPAHAATKPKTEADVVNLGYVLNVIEDPAERVETLIDAWKYVRKLLVVSTLISGDENYVDVQAFADGVLTRRSTFQKYFEQAELHALLEDTLQCEAVPVALGVFFAFRDIADLHDFLAARSRRYIDWEGISNRLGLVRATARRRDPYETHRDLLESFWEAALALGRLPRPEEFDRLAEVRRACGSLPKAFQLLHERFGAGAFESARGRRREDLLVYAAASQLRRRIPFAQLSQRLQYDIRSYFGSYVRAEELARELLFASGDSDELELALSKVAFGEVDAVEGHFTFHRDLLDELPPIVRAYVACAARLFGDPRQADLIKIHLHSKKLTFLHYDHFLENNFPQLDTPRIKIDLRRLFVTVFKYPPSGERQLLLFKERYLPKSDARRKKMDVLSARLRMHGVNENNVGHGPSGDDFAGWLRSNGLDASLRRNPALSAVVQPEVLKVSPKHNA